MFSCDLKTLADYNTNKHIVPGMVSSLDDVSIYESAMAHLHRAYQLRAAIAMVGLAALLALGIALIAAYGVTIAFLATPVGIGIAAGVGALLFALVIASVIKKCQHQSAVQLLKSNVSSSSSGVLPPQATAQLNISEKSIVDNIALQIAAKKSNWNYKLTTDISYAKILKCLAKAFPQFSFTFNDNNFHWVPKGNATISQVTL